MNNAMVAGIYAGCALLAAYMLYMSLRSEKRKRPVYMSFSVFCGCLLIWMVLCVAMALAPTQELTLLFLEMRMPFIAFIPVFFLSCVRSFFRKGRGGEASFFIKTAIIPMITTLLVCTNAWHHLFRLSAEVVRFVPFKIIEAKQGIWYPIHAVYSYILLLAGAAIAVGEARGIPSVFRSPARLLVIGGVVSVIANPLYLLFFTGDAAVDPTALITTVSSLLFFWALRNREAFDSMLIARDEIFQSVPNVVFVLDEREKVLDANKEAKAVFATAGVVDIIGHPFPEVLDKAMAGREGIVVDAQAAEQKAYYLMRSKSGMRLYDYVRSDFEDRFGNHIGWFVEMTDFTETHQHIQHLEDLAGVDALTGLANRRVYEEEIDKIGAQSYPLGIIVGDANDLKRINDTYGHESGDLLLTQVAAGMLAVAPDRALLARTGGDEFVLLLPQCEEQEAQALLLALRSEMRSRQVHGEPIPIALGHYVLTNPNMPVRTAIAIADQHMYASKSNDRRMRSGEGEPTAEGEG